MTTPQQDAYIQHIQFGPLLPYPAPPVGLTDGTAELAPYIAVNTAMLRQRIQRIEPAPTLWQIVARMLQSLTPIGA
jgi:hypothetical protein